MRRRAITPVALLALSCQATAPPPATVSVPPAPATTPVVEAPRPEPPPPDALVTVTAALAGLQPVADADAPWAPVTALRAVLRASGDLPLPGAPERHDDAVTWSMLLQQAAPAAAGNTTCAAVSADPHLACATDRVEHVGRIRTRVVVGWRERPATPVISRAQPLRALARVARGVCLVSAQETERTLDLTVRADDAPALGETLALLTVSPGLRELITVRVEPLGGGLQATLSWPLARATTRELGDDAWPTRCGGALDLGATLPNATLPVARTFIPGSRARGAVMTLGRVAWVVTVGDRLARATVTAIDEGGVTLQRPGVARPTRLPWRP